MADDNTSTLPNALIETYESELYFFLQRPYHIPARSTRRYADPAHLNW